MHWQALQFVQNIKGLFGELFVDRLVLEIGSSSVNGSVRQLFDTESYVGVDLAAGPGVDVIGSGHEFESEERFDICISCECFEHNPYYLETVNNMIAHSSEESLVIFTCATEGRPEHGTARTDPNLSPGTSSLGWNYYKNLVSEDFSSLDLDGDRMSKCLFFSNRYSNDLYFVGTKSQRLAKRLEENMHRIDEWNSLFESISGDSDLFLDQISKCQNVQLVPMLLFNMYNKLGGEVLDNNSDYRSQVHNAFLMWPGSPEINFILSRFYSCDFQKDNALLFAKRAAALSSFSGFYINSYADLLDGLGLTQLAINALKKAPGILSKGAIQWKLGDMSLRVGDVESAYLYANSAISLEPENPIYLYLKYRVLVASSSPEANLLSDTLRDLKTTPGWILQALNESS